MLIYREEHNFFLGGGPSTDLNDGSFHVPYSHIK